MKSVDDMSAITSVDVSYHTEPEHFKFELPSASETQLYRTKGFIFKLYAEDPETPQNTIRDKMSSEVYFDELLTEFAAIVKAPVYRQQNSVITPKQSNPNIASL